MLTPNNNNNNNNNNCNFLSDICDETGTDTCDKDVEFGRILIPPFFPFKEGSLKMWVEK